MNRLPSSFRLPASISEEEAIRYSFADYHVKGFDYVCLKRTDRETIKIYFFDGDVSDLPEVVIPHNHRYAFHSTVLAGEVENRQFIQVEEGVRGGEPYECFDYSTPLNGGDGFTWRHTTWLKRSLDLAYVSGETYFQNADDLHTIKVGPNTVLCLHQYEDVIPMGKPTQAFKPEGHRRAPSLDGLYNQMTGERLRERMNHLRHLTGLSVLVV